MKYRSRSDIVGLLLDAANGGGATKTKLMYKAYLSFNQLKEYLTLLVENTTQTRRIVSSCSSLIHHGTILFKGGPIIFVRLREFCQIQPVKLLKATWWYICLDRNTDG